MGVLGPVVSPCLIACVYHLVLGHHQAALLYAVPSLCCGLLYLGLLYVFGVESALEMGLMALIICIICAELTPIVIKRYVKRHAGGTVKGSNCHAEWSQFTNLSSVELQSGKRLVRAASRQAAVF